MSKKKEDESYFETVDRNDFPRGPKNPYRQHPNQRLTGWNIEEYKDKNNQLEKAVKKAINHLGFDSALNIPDYILASHLVRTLWNLARSTADLDFHFGRVDDGNDQIILNDRRIQTRSEKIDR